MPDPQPIASTLELAGPIRSSLLRAWGSLLRILPRYRRRVFFWGWKCLGAPKQFVGSVAGRPFVVDTRDFEVAMHCFTYGCYEPAVSLAVMSLLRPGDTFVDIGANKGYFSLIASTRVGAAGSIVSYEPNKPNISNLRLTQQSNSTTRWEVIPAAISDKSGTLRFIFPDASAPNSGWGRVDASGGFEVSAVTLDAELDRLGIQHVRLVKMDIEGHELAALRGMSRALDARRIEHLVIEIHRPNITDADLINDVREMSARGYIARTIREHADDTRRCLRAAGHPHEPIDASELFGPLEPLPPASVDRYYAVFSLDSAGKID